MRRVIAAIATLVVLAVLAVWLIVLPSRVVRAVRIPNEATPAAFGVAFSDVSFPTRGGTLTLRGWWMPDAAAKGVIIFVHGGNANRRDLYAGGLEMQAFLSKRHLSVLAFDLRNHGQSDAAPDGQITLGVDEASDVRGAVDFARARAPGLPVYLLADSMGGAAAIYATAEDTRVVRIALIDPVLDADSAEAGAVHATTGLPRLLLPPVVWSVTHIFSHVPGRHEPLEVALRLRLPVLLIQDDRDPVCLPQFADRLAVANRHVTLWVSHDPDAGAGSWGRHVGAYRLHTREVQSRLAQFFGVGD
jgi:pimeloyl-ACP methyl ester carboxylesterase